MDSTSSESLLAWLERLISGGWIDRDQVQFLHAGEETTAEDLFATPTRPLIVAFFGGTGVGKSTLLNRLAGEKVARTGIERPTSREITVYLHHSLPTDRLKLRLSLERLRLAGHRNANRRDVVWIDMPDIDSVELANRDLVLQCLPYVDVLIYVVSPARYRDDSGWQLLRKYGHRHAWLFVMNHWDEGCEEQIEDFDRQLREAGFSDPIILRCDSREDLASRRPDDFGKLEELLTQLVRSGGIEQLQAHNQRQRQAESLQHIECLLRILGEPEGVDELKQHWRNLWRQTQKDLEPALQWPIQALAREITGKGQKRLVAGADTGETLLWDLWTRKHLSAAIDRLILSAADLELATEPLRRRLETCHKNIEDILTDQVQRAVRVALVKPGNGLQRALLWLTGVLRYLLPLGASGWVGWQVVTRYYQGFVGERDWLGVDFAVHSTLLIAVAWLVPFLLHRLLYPSLEKAAEVGIRTGIRKGFRKIATEVEEGLEDLKKELWELRQQGKQLCSEYRSAPLREDVRLVRRFLVDLNSKDNGIN